MSVKSNSPALSYISWDNCYITYNDNNYMIQNSYTMKKYIYWNYINPYQFEVSDKLLDEIGGRYLVIVNDKGLYSLPTLNGITMTFTEEGGNTDLIVNQIQAFHEVNEENGERFVTIEKSIDGINTNVIQIQNDNKTLTEKVSQIEQTADNIDLKVSKVEREFNDNTLRDAVNSALLSLNSTLGSFSSDMSDYMKDNTITEKEALSIQTYKTNLLSDKTDVDVQVDLVLNNLKQNGETDNYTILKTQKETFDSSIDELTNIIDTAIIDGLITSAEITNITTAFGKVNTNSLLLNNTLDEIIFLGVGGKIFQQLANISVKSDRILLTVSKVEQTLKNSLNIEKSKLQTQISDLYTSIDNISFEIEVAIQDREIDEMDRDNVQGSIDAMEDEFNDLKDKYTSIVNSDFLTNDTKSVITDSYNLLKNIKNNLISKINQSFSDNIINDNEINIMTQCITDYKNNVDLFHQDLCYALDEIQTNDWNKQLTDAKNDFSKEVQDLKNEIDNISNDIDESIKSGLVDSIEKEKILGDVSQLQKEKSVIDTKFEKWYTDEFLLGEDRIKYKNSYDNFVKEYNDLINVINSIANSTTLVSEDDKDNVEKAKDSFNKAVADFYTASDEVINIIAKNEMDYLNNSLKKELNETNNAIGTLETSLNEAFKNSIITESEMAQINSILVQIEKEKEDVDKRYEEIYNNENLK